jgi:AcrR family transcriptional regulator
MPRPPAARATALAAADALLSEEGIAAFTLEAVAARAGISKGGLLYHFPTKEALLAALMRRCLDEETDPTLEAGTPARLRMPADLAEHRPALGAMMAAAAQNPALMAMVADHHARRFEALGRDGARYARSLALEAMWLIESLGGRLPAQARAAALRAIAEDEARTEAVR